jgi:hypothetical protein
MAHWQDYNPWADRLIYTASLEEWLDCLLHQGQRYHYEQIAGSSKCDTYLLIQPNGEYCMGLRYGPKGEDYYSPTCNWERAKAVVDKYTVSP